MHSLKNSVRTSRFLLVALFMLNGVACPPLLPAQAASAKAQDFSAQEQCHRQAFEIYKSDGYVSDPTASYTIHFNGKLKQCFVLFRKVDRSTMPGNELELRLLLDAATKKTYGNYVFSMESQRTVECDVLDSGDKKKDCSSAAEFEALIASYME